MKEKILVIGTGGTIASVKNSGVISLDSPFKVIEYSDGKTDFICRSPFAVLSENINFTLWEKLIEFIKERDSDEYAGIIILHGSDTLAYTGALIANIFYDKNICLTASDKPIEDETSNGTANFNTAVNYILKKNTGVTVSYNGIYDAQTLTSADCRDKFRAAGKHLEEIKNPRFRPKNILLIKPYPGIRYDNYDLTDTDIVLHEMYHSTTVPQNAETFFNKCEELEIPFYFVTPKPSAEYETAVSIKENIIFNSTTENAFARLLLT